MSGLDLPKAFEEFSEARRNAFISLKNKKESGTHLIGVYCTFFPTEITAAMGIECVSLCSFSQETVPDAEKDLPANLCPLVKSSYGFGKTEKCPFFYFADVIVGETTCDGKKKMYEQLAKFKKVYVMELPNRQSRNGLVLWTEEIKDFVACLEKEFGIAMEEAALKEAIHEKNEIRDALMRFTDIMKLDPAPMNSHQLFGVLSGSAFDFDRKTLPARLDNMREEIMSNYKPEELKSKPRILVTGCPLGEGDYKIVNAIEANGGVVVAYENCGGLKPIVTKVDETKDDPYEALAEKYLSIGCSCMSPNPNRKELLQRIMKEYKVDGVVELVLHACHTYAVETQNVAEWCDEMDVPFLSVSADFSDTDCGQISTRVGAFIEMLM